MKKIVSLITMAAMLAVSTPAIANGKHSDNRWGADSNRNSPYYNQSNKRHRNKDNISTGEAVAIGIGALILGAAIANSNRNERVVVERYPNRRQPRQVCEDIVQYDYYGNPYVAGRDCWYER